MINATRQAGFIRVDWDGQQVVMYRSTSPSPVYASDFDPESSVAGLFRTWSKWFDGSPTSVDLDPDSTMCRSWIAPMDASRDAVQFASLFREMAEDAGRRSSLLERQGCGDWASAAGGEQQAYLNAAGLMLSVGRLIGVRDESVETDHFGAGQPA